MRNADCRPFYKAIAPVSSKSHYKEGGKVGGCSRQQTNAKWEGLLDLGLKKNSYHRHFWDNRRYLNVN